MNSDVDESDKFGPVCNPQTPCPAGFEKIVDIDNLGLIMYRRLGMSKNKQKEITCQRCYQIVELALRLLQKIPAINKKAAIRVCDRCKKKYPCPECKETAKRLLSKHDADPRAKKEQQTDLEWDNEAKGSVLDKKTVKHKKSESEIRIEELLRREYTKPERELKIRELCPKPSRDTKTSRYTKSLPSIGKSKHWQSEQPFLIIPSSDSKISIDKGRTPFMDKSSSDSKICISNDKNLLLIDQPFMVKPPSDSKISIDRGKKHQCMTKPLNDSKKYEENSFAPDEPLSDFDLGKPIYPPSILRNKERGRRERGEDFLSELPSKGHLENYDKMLLHLEKSKYDEDIYPKHLRNYAHGREKYVDEQNLGANAKKYIEDKKKYGKPNAKTFKDKNFNSEVEEPDFQLQEDFKIIYPKRKDFNFSFPIDNVKSEKIVTHKTSLELLNEIQEGIRSKNEIIKQKFEAKRLQKVENKERKRLATEQKAKLIADKESVAEYTKNELEKTKVMEKNDVAENTKKELEETKVMENIDLDLNKKENKEILKQEETEAAERNLAGTTAEIDSKMQGDQITSQPHDLTSDPDLKKKKVQELEIAGLKQERNEARASFKQNKKQEKQFQKDEKDLWNIKKNTDKSEAKTKHPIKLVNDKKKETKQQRKHVHEYELEDMLRNKKIFKPKDISHLARLQAPNKIKTETASTGEKAKKKINDLQVKKIKVIPSKHDPILVKFRKGAIGQKYKYDGENQPMPLDIHEKYHKVLKDSHCQFCLNSDLELNIESIKHKKGQTNKCIKGEKIVNINELQEISHGEIKPLLFTQKVKIPIFDDEPSANKLPPEREMTKKEPVQPQVTPTGSGVLNYALSDRKFIDKGWTLLPTEKIMRKINVYRMRPAKPEFDWFKRNQEKKLIFYDSGERFAEYEDDGRCRWYYKNQRLALDYYDAQELHAQQRFVLHSNGEPDERGRPRPNTVLAMFDYLGNGVVFNHGGKIRLKYNQTEGVILDKSIGPVSQWKWHTLNDPPELQQVMIDTQLTHKDPNLLAMGIKPQAKSQLLNPPNEDMLAIEFENAMKSKSKKLTQVYKPLQIKMKALKINEHFSLKILDQAYVYLIYRDGKTNIKLNLGMLLDSKEIIDTDTVEVGEVANNIERSPARTDSLFGMQRSVAYAERFERSQTKREQRIRPPAPSASADKLTAATSRPLRPPLRVLNPPPRLGSSTVPASCVAQPCCYIGRTLPSSNVYYSTI